MTKIDSLKSYTFFNENFNIIFVICIKVIKLSLLGNISLKGLPYYLL